MMLLIYAGMLTTLFLGWRRKEKAALWFCFVTLILLISWFLWDVYSPIYGFHMPWITL